MTTETYYRVCETDKNNDIIDINDYHKKSEAKKEFDRIEKGFVEKVRRVWKEDELVIKDILEKCVWEKGG